MRTDAVNEFLHNTVSRWTLPGGISASDDGDQERLLRFLRTKPEFEQAVLAQMHASARYMNSMADAAQRGLAVPGSPAALPGNAWPANSAAMPTRTMTLSSAFPLYRERYVHELETQTERTADDKIRMLKLFQDFLAHEYAHLGSDPLLHTIESCHVNAFLKAQNKRPGKRTQERVRQLKEANPDAIIEAKDLPGSAPLTSLKKLSDLRHFFEFCIKILKVVLENPTAGLADSEEAWKAKATSEDVHYLPFTDSHFKEIFAPERYLTLTRDADHFWCPLVAAHLGCRLGEIVNRRLVDIGYIEEIGVWYVDVPEEGAKNDNSIRRLPITKQLLDLGFGKYVDHLRRLGATHLFPNRDWTTPTALKDPSKTQSARFGLNLNRIGIMSPFLVCHSFRGTVVSVLHDAGVPLSHAMQICGHEAQKHAIDTGSITKEQARSVHQTVYTRADLQRLGTEFPILPLKDALERAVKLPIDYKRLAACAEIVRQHTRKVGKEFTSGWPAQKVKYTAELVKRIAR